MSLPELDVRCWNCWGNGIISLENHGEMIECPECSGIGWLPTEDGKRLLNFLQRHMVVDVDKEE